MSLATLERLVDSGHGGPTEPHKISAVDYILAQHHPTHQANCLTCGSMVPLGAMMNLGGNV